MENKKEEKESGPNIVKVFDKLFLLGVGIWILFAWIMPAIFNADNDVTMWMVFLVFALGIYAVGRVIAKLLQKLTDE